MNPIDNFKVLESKITELINQIDLLRNEKLSLENNNNEVRKKLQVALEKIDVLENENVDLRNKNIDYEEKVGNLIDKISFLTNSITKSKDKNVSVEQKVVSIDVDKSNVTKDDVSIPDDGNNKLFFDKREKNKQEVPSSFNFYLKGTSKSNT